jgi:F0F1-type ATP synthase assembly protein I
MAENGLSLSERLVAGAVIACGPIGGLLIGISDSGSTTRTLGFILLGVFLLGGMGLNIWAVRRSRRPG